MLENEFVHEFWAKYSIVSLQETAQVLHQLLSFIHLHIP